MKAVHVATRTAESVADQFQKMQKQITERAYDIFRNRGSAFGPLEDWLAAERETIWKPPVEVCQKDNEILIEAALAGVDPGDLDVQLTPESILIQANVAHDHTEQKGIVHQCDFEPGRLFRTIALPFPIDPDSASAEYKNGLLRLTVKIAAGQQARKIDIQAA